MAEERQYTIPLRREWLKVPQYRRAGRAVKAIKEFIAKHMKVPDRDTRKVKLDIYSNNEIWYRGRTNPPSKVKVIARKDGDLVKVELLDLPESIKFLKAKHEKMHLKAEKPKAPPAEIKPKEIKEKTEEEKKEEKEKEQSVAEAAQKQAHQAAKAQKHIIKKKEPTIRRMALKK